MPIKSKIAPAGKDRKINDTSLLVEHIPKTTKEAFKSACALNGVTMRDIVIQLMRSYVNQQKDIKE